MDCRAVHAAPHHPTNMLSTHTTHPMNTHYSRPPPVAARRLRPHPRPHHRPRSVLRALPLCRLPNGFTVRHASTPGEVLFLFEEVYSVRTYLQHGVALRAGDTVLDVGANLGLSAMLAAEEVGPTGRVFAIEPAPQTAAALAINLQEHARWWQQSQNKQVGSSVVLPVAITDAAAPTTVDFTVYQGAAGWSTLQPDDAEVVANMQRYVRSLLQQPEQPHKLDHGSTGSPPPTAPDSSTRGLSPLEQTLVACARQLDRVPWLSGLVDTLTSAYVQLVMLRRAETVTVPAVSISTIIDEHGIRQVHCLKVDVERAELQVLQGIQPHHWQLIQQVTMEVHDINGRLAEVVALLERQGFSVVCDQMSNLMGTDLHNVYATRTGTPE